VGPGVWSEHWQLGANGNGERARTARLEPVVDVPALNEVIGLGMAVSTTAASCRLIYPHPAVRYVPVVDALGSDIAIARRRDGDPLAATFADVAAEVARELSDLLPGSRLP